MNFFEKLKFVLTYNIRPGFIVVPFGTDRTSWVCNDYEAALEVIEREFAKNPMYGKPNVLVMVKKK